MQHSEIAPCAKLRHVNGSFDVEASPFHFPRSAMPWPKNARGTHVAGINSFGMGGSNAFVVVESFQPEAAAAQSAAEPAAEPALFALSARSEQSLHAYAASVAAFARAQAARAEPAATFADRAYVTQIGRVAWRHRLAVVARDATELAEALEAWSTTPLAPRAGLYACDSESPVAADTLRLLEGEAGRMFFASLLEMRKLDTLAEMWTRGAGIDWEALHRARSRRRASFPGAPFELVRCDLRHLLDGAGIAALAAPIAAAQTQSEASTPAVLEAIDLPPGGWHRLDALASTVDASPAAEIDEYTLPDDTACELAKALGEEPLLLEEGVVDESTLHYVSELVDTELLQTLQAFGREHSIAIETLVTATWAVLMNRHTRARRSQFGVYSTGLCAKAPTLLTLRAETVSRQKVLPWLQAFQGDLLRRHRDALTSIEQARGWGDRGAPYDTLVAFDSGTAAESESAARPSSLRPRYELAIAVTEASLELTLIYRARTPDYARAGMLLEQFVVLLEGVVRNPDKVPSALGMRTRAESRERFWKTMEAITE
jgi:polyketide synthase PksN